MSQFEADNLTAEVVAQYLRDFPDFFQERRDLVDQLALPTREQGAFSLVELQIKRQRQRIGELEEEITDLMSIAANNDQTFHQFMGLQEKVLKCQSVQQVIECIEKSANQLSLKSHVKLIGSQSPRYSMSHENWQRFATNHFNGKDAYLGRLKRQDRELLFGQETTTELGSYVILPLSQSTPLGIIAFSSEDGGHFQPAMDTLFLRHLALVVSHLVSTLQWNTEEYQHVINQTTSA
ncbi:3',5'-cyclic-nucleotide phosphodiesterase [Vibrio sp. MACH09]|uniref:DUF484 family protein n=1 Tax=Vibrio sp. MACH09 TaxID=3025122 RepID=UPI002793FE95|nr:DUF484 family protein [Vibrio sp. MACH09]GLO62308.1 3',5'-cyclic-nucleotide phosphodiesterase [Vibrio sp. MACH09]